MNNSKIYYSNRKFKIWAYTVSHSTLILRSEKQYFDVDYDIIYDDSETTIDLEFTGISFISIPEKFAEIMIEKKGAKYIFNNNEDWFIEASSCVVGKSDWDYNNDRILNASLKYDSILVI